MSALLSTRIDAIHTGTAKPIDGNRLSAIFKTPVSGTATFGPMGIDGDTQVDREHHGGVDKAVHFYSSTHYAYWKTVFPQQADIFTPGCFGENLLAQGFLENEVCLGDRFTLGSAVLEVSQGRQPCWKLGKKTGIDRMPVMVERTGRTGFYCRVTENGTVKAGTMMTLADRPHPDWPLTRLWQTIFRKGASTADLETLLALPVLSQAWRTRVRNKLVTRSKTA